MDGSNHRLFKSRVGLGQISIFRSRWAVIYGASGSGKTTFIKKFRQVEVPLPSFWSRRYGRDKTTGTVLEWVKPLSGFTLLPPVVEESLKTRGTIRILMVDGDKLLKWGRRPVLCWRGPVIRGMNSGVMFSADERIEQDNFFKVARPKECLTEEKVAGDLVLAGGWLHSTREVGVVPVRVDVLDGGQSILKRCGDALAIPKFSIMDDIDDDEIVTLDWWSPIYGNVSTIGTLKKKDLSRAVEQMKFELAFFETVNGIYPKPGEYLTPEFTRLLVSVGDGSDPHGRTLSFSRTDQVSISARGMYMGHIYLGFLGQPSDVDGLARQAVRDTETMPIDASYDILLILSAMDGDVFTGIAPISQMAERSLDRALKSKDQNGVNLWSALQSYANVSESFGSFEALIDVLVFRHLAITASP